MNKNILKAAAAINVVVFIVCGIMYLQAENINPNDGWNGFAFIWFWASLAITVVVLAVAAFIGGITHVVIDSTVAKAPKSPYRNIVISIFTMLIPVPLLFFAFMADDRQPLLVLGWLMEVLATCGLVFVLIRAILKK